MNDYKWREATKAGLRLAYANSESIRAFDIYETALHRMLAMSNADPKAYADCARDALDKVAKLKETT